MSEEVSRSDNRSKSDAAGPDADHTIDIAIVGAGIAGLYCGFKLSELAKSVSDPESVNFRIFEESDHIGGRILTMRVLDNGQILADDIDVKIGSDGACRPLEAKPTSPTYEVKLETDGTIRVIGSDETKIPQLEVDSTGVLRVKGKASNPPRVEFCAEFGPMRIELDVQEKLKELIKALGLEDDLQSFPPYDSPVSEHDPLYELEGEERDQKTPLDLLKLGIVRILGNTRSDEEWGQSEDEADPNSNWPSLQARLKNLSDRLSVAVSTRQPDWTAAFDEWVKQLRDKDYQNLRQHGIFNVKVQIEKTCEASDEPGIEKLASRTYLWQMGFWNLLSEVLSHHAVMKIRDLGTFYHLIGENPNAVEWLIFWLRAFSTSDRLVGLRGGMQRITAKLASTIAARAHPERILRRRRLSGIWRPDDSPFIRLTFATLNDAGNEIGTEEWQAKRVILAIPTGPLQDLAKLNARSFYEEFHRDLGAVFGFPLLKYFFGVKERWWNEDRTYNNRFATLIPTRETHYWQSPLDTSKKGLILFYTDRPATTYWSNFIAPPPEECCWDKPGSTDPLHLSISSGRQLLPEMGSRFRTESGELRDIKNTRLMEKTVTYMRNHGVSVEINDIQFYGIRDWGREPYVGAAHAWYPERKSWKVLERLSCIPMGHYSWDDKPPDNQVPEDIPTVHICGEAYSDYQAFIEGALRSATHVLHIIKPNRFDSATPWLKGCRIEKRQPDAAKPRDKQGI